MTLEKKPDGLPTILQSLTRLVARLLRTGQFRKQYFPRRYHPMQLLEDNLPQLIEACQAHEVRELYAFGSVLTSDFTAESDVDLIVSIADDDPIDYAEHYFSLKFAIEKILGRRIDLLEAKAIKNPVFKRLVDKEKKLLYASGDIRVARRHREGHFGNT